jgi:RNA polymerase sigma factor (sigma-70 family)
MSPQGLSAFPRSASDLVSACCRMDDGAWDEFITRYNRRVSLYITRACRFPGWSRDDRGDLARDLTQEVYVRLLADECRALKAWRGESEEAFLGYLAKVVHAVACDALRRERSLKRSANVVSYDGMASEEGPPLAEVIPAGDASSPDRMLAERTAPKRLRSALRSLHAGPNDDRNAMIFQLHVLDGLTASEIAGLPEIRMQIPSVESVLRRTRERLRTVLRSPENLTG